MDVQAMTQQVLFRRKLFFVAQSAVLTSLMLFNTQNHAEQYYKWVDNKGSTHYTTTPPPKGSKKQGHVNTYGHTPRSAQNSTQNNESNRQQSQQSQQSQPTTDNGNKNQSSAPVTNAPQSAPKSQQTSPSVKATTTNRAA